MTDRHLHKPKSVRIPGGLLAWLGEQAAAEGRRPNAVIVAALEEYRARYGSTAPEAPRTPHRAQAHTQPRDEPACRHPAESVDVDAGQCRACGADIW